MLLTVGPPAAATSTPLKWGMLERRIIALGSVLQSARFIKTSRMKSPRIVKPATSQAWPHQTNKAPLLLVLSIASSGAWPPRD
jgi:hypothetical protein